MKALRLLLAALFMVVLLVGLLQFWPRPRPDHPFFANFDSYPLAMGHADDTGSGLWPGNTLPYLDGIAGLGVDVLEMDVNMTRDGHIVLMHDTTVDRTTSGSGRAADLTLAELKALEVGGNWTQDEGATYPYQGAGVQVPTLAEVFERFPDYPMIIEIKQEDPPLTAPLCDLIRTHSMQEKVIIPSFSDTAIRAFRETCPEVATAASSDEARQFVLLNFLFLANLISPEYEAFQVPIESGGIPVVRPAFIWAAQRRNLQTHVWTINDPAEMDHLIELGSEGIMSDRPDVFLERLGRDTTTLTGKQAP